MASIPTERIICAQLSKGDSVLVKGGAWWIVTRIVREDDGICSVEFQGSGKPRRIPAGRPVIIARRF